jgi:hypothetical protein
LMVSASGEPSRSSVVITVLAMKTSLVEKSRRSQKRATGFTD